jgi:phosphatidate cytidylyltransferase
MLRTRILTALVLLLIVAAAVSAASSWPMLILLTAMCACAWWEWLRLVPVRARRAGWLAGAFAVLLLMASAGLLQGSGWAAPWAHIVVLSPAVLFWLLAAPRAVLRAELPGYWRAMPLAALGLWLLAATWYALAGLFLAHGAAALISLWALVWCADIAAYFVGRCLGRHKLAPRVSPGKSREGAVGGIVAAVLWLAATAVWWPGSFGALLLGRLGWPALIVSGILLAAWSIVGDLFESLLKRRAGVKDSSQLLPGHGGVYDRIDAVLPVAPAAILLLLL